MCPKENFRDTQSLREWLFSLLSNKFPTSSSLGIVESLIGGSLDLEVTRFTEAVPDLIIDFK